MRMIHYATHEQSLMGIFYRHWDEFKRARKAVLEYLYDDNFYLGIKPTCKKYNVTPYIFQLYKEYLEHITGVYNLDNKKTGVKFYPDKSWRKSAYNL